VRASDLFLEHLHLDTELQAAFNLPARTMTALRAIAYFGCPTAIPNRRHIDMVGPYA
jgi:hypothetical protein